MVQILDLSTESVPNLTHGLHTIKGLGLRATHHPEPPEGSEFPEEDILS